MKKSNFIRLLVLMMVLITGVTSSYAYTLYFYIGRTTWVRNDGAVIKVNSSDADGGTTLERVGSTDWYSCTAPGTGTYYFVRCNPSGGKWNSLGSVSISSTNNVIRCLGDNSSEAFTMHVVGDSWNNIGNRDNTDPDGAMAITATNTFSKTFTNVAASVHEFKIVENNRWEYAIGTGGTITNTNCDKGDNSGNITFTPYIASGNTTITYNISTNAITITCPKIPITLNKNSGDNAGSATVDVGASSLSTISHATRAGWNLTGYWTNTSGGYKVIDADGTFVAYNANVATYLNNVTPSTWKKTDATTLYAQWTQDPSVATLTESSSTTQMWIGVNPTSALTFSATSANVSSGTAVTWSLTDNTGDCTVSTTTSSYAGATFSYTPGSTGAKTITVTMTVGGNNYTKTYSLTVYERWNIYVQNNCSWASGVALYMFNNGTNEDWPGAQGTGTGCETYGSHGWYKVTLDSYYPKFILDNNQASSGIEQTNDCTTGSSSGTYEEDTYWYFNYDKTTTDSKSDGKKYYTLTKYTLSAPTVGLTATVTSTNQINLTGNVSAYGGYGSSASDMEEVYFKVNNTKDAASITVSTTNGNFTKTLNNPTPDNTNNTLQAYASNVKGTGTSSAIRFTKITLNKQSGSGGTDNVLAVNGAAMASGATAPSRTGYTFGGYYASTGGSGTNYYNSSMGSANNWDQTTATKTIYAKWTANTYSIHFNGNGSTSGEMSDQTGIAYDSETAITTNVFVKTGYNFAGWATTAEKAAAGTVDRTDGAAHGNLSSTQGATVNLYAVWTPKQSALSFDYQSSAEGHGTDGSISAVSATYDAAMPALSGSMPTAAEGYAFMGFYDATSGGTKYYNADGTSAHTWDKEDASVTLYARWEKAEITGLTLSKTTVSPGETGITVTPTFDPTPTETTIVCYEIQYSDGTALSPQPASTYNTGTKVLTFTAPSASATYKIHATLETGSTCGSGTELSTLTTTFQVAGSHTVTVEYKQSSTTIKTSTSVTANPTDWSDEIAAPDIFGYTFSSWSAGDGVTITNDDGETSGTSSSSATIKIKAISDGTLTANYTQKSLIYFKNTLGWSSVYVNFYGNDGYWDDKGSGNKSFTNRNKAMSQIGESDVWYYDYGEAGITPTKWVAFTQDLQNGDGSGAQNFWASGTGEPVSYPARRADDLADKAGETGFYSATPMFVPLAGQTPVTLNEGGGGKALYYNSGYWTKYLPGTGYTLEIYNEAGNSKLKEMDFSSADELMPMKAVADLEATTTYKFQIKRHGDVYLGNSGTMTYTDHGQNVAWEMTNTDFEMCKITTTAAGDYTFNFTYSAYNNESTGKDEYRLRLSVDYPVADGDYRLIYTDETRSFMDDEVKKYRFKPSAIVSKENNGTAIVSFFVRQNQTPVLRIQQASVDGSGNITWNEYPNSGTPTNQITDDIASAIDETGVYNFNLSMNGSGALSVTSATDYTGNFYIRTDAANSKWDNYRTDLDHLMTYSDYAATKSASASNTGYTHYYTHWVNKDDVGRKNVKFVIANDYSPCISDTLAREAADGTWANIATFMEEGGDLKRSANVRFMWNIVTNEVSRAYVDGAQEDGSQFLLLLSGDSKIKQGETTKTSVTFSDNGNWIYETNIKAQPGAQIKLKSTWGEGTTIVQFFKGSEDDYEQLVGGNTENWYDFRLIYDFKTNRLVSSYVPTTGRIETNVEINADVMFIREHQGDIAQLTFGASGKISKIETAYGVMRFNRWTLNNKDDEEPHSSLPVEDQISNFERGLYWISFPFKVNLNEAFGFGTYGTHWIMMRYNGARRATEGYWADSEGFWEYITNRNTILQPNEGYVLALDLDLLGVSSSIFANTDVIELYFPSYGDMPDISSSDVTTSLEAHQCTIDRTNGGAYNVNKNRTIADSHWNVMGVPTYVNTDDIVYKNDTWTSAVTGVGPNFLYVWKAEDNSYVPTSARDYTYKAMHAYMVQYYGAVSWAAKSGSPYPSSIAARKAETQDVEYRLELQSDTRMEDQTFVRFTDDAAATTGFEFGQDLSKEYNGNRSNIYTFTAGTPVAGNSQPHPLTTTIVPVGVKIAANGEYTFSMPEGTNGGDVWLIDNANSSRTNLGLMNYTVNLTTGTYEGRFSLEFPVQNVVTDIENAANANANANADVRKVFVGGRLYILRDGKAYDATGAQVR